MINFCEILISFSIGKNIFFLSPQSHILPLSASIKFLWIYVDKKKYINSLNNIKLAVFQSWPKIWPLTKARRAAESSCEEQKDSLKMKWESAKSGKRKFEDVESWMEPSELENAKDIEVASFPGEGQVWS